MPNKKRLAWFDRPDREHPIAIRESACIHYVIIEHALELLADLTEAVNVAWLQCLEVRQSANSAESTAGGPDA
jgi:hypothetical protein